MSLRENGRRIVAAAMLMLGWLIPSAVQARPASRVLVLYDAGTKRQDSEWTGPLNGKLMRNLLGHFAVAATIKSLAAYRHGDLDQYDATFYLGTAYDDPLPDAFRQDAMSTAKTLCWIGYNLWQIAWTGNAAEPSDNPAFVRHFGIRFLGTDKSGYSDIRYHGHKFNKSQDDRELGKVAIADPTRATAIATALRKPDLATPYIIHSANFWYVADNPFDNITSSDRYFVFADVLHDVLEINHPESHRAVARIEDVHPLTPAKEMREIGERCKSLGVPFVVSVIPEYRDPLGAENNGSSKTVKMTEAPEFIDTLRYLEQCGGQLVMHGYTHQYGNIPNPYNGITADDAEFYRITSNANNSDEGAPVAGDSAKWARDRIRAGLRLFRQSHLVPLGWNTPHYEASATDYRQFARMFRLFVDRAQYFVTDSTGNLHATDQVPPYVLTDIYGCFRIPETLGYLRLNPTPEEPYVNTPEDMANAANAYLAVRDGWAAFYYHPEDLDREYLYDAIVKIKALGYKFVPITSVSRTQAGRAQRKRQTKRAGAALTPQVPWIPSRN
jgi:uncharacterized protein YdaL